MNIQIDKNYSIKSDPRNVMLVEKKISQEGKEYETTVSYHGTVQGCLKSYLDLKTKVSEATTIQELLNDVKEIKKTIENVLQGI